MHVGENRRWVPLLSHRKAERNIFTKIQGVFFSTMVYLKAYSLTYIAHNQHCDSDNAREYYKNINPQGLSDNYSFSILSTSVTICHI